MKIFVQYNQEERLEIEMDPNEFPKQLKRILFGIYKIPESHQRLLCEDGTL